MQLTASWISIIIGYALLPMGGEITVPVGTTADLGEGETVERALGEWTCKIHRILLLSKKHIPVSVSRIFNGRWYVSFLKLPPLDTP